MIAPLFNATLALQAFEPSKTGKEAISSLYRSTLKQFLLIPKTTNTTLLGEMVEIDLEELILKNEAINKEKWEARKSKLAYFAGETEPKTNTLRGVPGIWSDLIRTQVRTCTGCNIPGIVTSRWHLKYKHGFSLPHINRVWEKEIKPVSSLKYRKIWLPNGEEKSVLIPRREVSEKLIPVIENRLSEYNATMETITLKKEQKNVRKIIPFTPL
jgi:hypothetical protein